MTMESTNIDVLISLKGEQEASAGVNRFSGALEMNRSVIRQLYTGAIYAGSALMSMGVAMKNTNNATLQQVGGMFAMVGGFMSAVGAAGHMVVAISKITSALKAMNIAQMISAALSGPAGWAKLAGAAAVIGVGSYAINRAMNSVAPVDKNRGQTVVHQYVQGSVVSQQELLDDVHSGLLIKQGRNNGTGLK